MSGGIGFWTLTLLAGGLGAWLRWVILLYPISTLPMKLLLINIVGSFLLGILSLKTDLMVLGAGFLGGLTTFSTWIQCCNSLSLIRKALLGILVPVITAFAFYLGVTRCSFW